MYYSNLHAFLRCTYCGLIQMTIMQTVCLPSLQVVRHMRSLPSWRSTCGWVWQSTAKRPQKTCRKSFYQFLKRKRRTTTRTRRSIRGWCSLIWGNSQSALPAKVCQITRSMWQLSFLLSRWPPAQPDRTSFADSKYFQLRCHLYQGRGLMAAEDNGLSSPFVKVIFATQCQASKVGSNRFGKVLKLQAFKLSFYNSIQSHY